MVLRRQRCKDRRVQKCDRVPRKTQLDRAASPGPSANSHDRPRPVAVQDSTVAEAQSTRAQTRSVKTLSGAPASTLHQS